ncbi:MAG: type II toxin-antitoxin system RelE/ParE family toxin [Flavobacteriaceae bacterium]|jgi:plasmid stabilization system protein ParE|nr:type II toxin-antitoxin system RelE/ParE family toxin [Flavobacteriaceae bacterium]
MRSGYKIVWTDFALEELRQTIEYLENNFSDKEIKKLAEKIESTLQIISENLDIFPKSESTKIHKAVILKYNTLYYRCISGSIEILSFFSNRQNPEKRNILN